MQSSFRYGTAKRLAFYIKYFLRKTVSLWFEVRTPKIRMFLYEMMYSSRKLLDYNSLVPSPFDTDVVETVFGRFRIRPRTVDMSNVSPAFERDDMDHLLGLMAGLKGEGRRILFLDVGADLGTFTVTVGNSMKGYDGLRMMAFEPAPSSFALLRENIALNGLDDITDAYNIALWSERGELGFGFNPVTPGSSGIATRGEESLKVRADTVDNVVGDEAGAYGAIVFKMDVEGVESDVLRGAERTLRLAREAHFLVEDFINPAVIGYLEDIGAEFITKLTPYNSWWRIRNDRADIQ